MLLGLGVGGDGLSGDLDRDSLETTETKSTCLHFFLLCDDPSDSDDFRT